MSIVSSYRALDQWVGSWAGKLEDFLARPGVVPVLIVLLWACGVLPNLTVRSFIYEEGTNAEIARDVLAHGHFLEPYVYGIRWHEKPSLLGWLIAGFALLTGGVNEWSARLPAMVLGPDHGVSGAAHDAAPCRPARLVVRGRVVCVLSVVAAKTDRCRT